MRAVFMGELRALAEQVRQENANYPCQELGEACLCLQRAMIVLAQRQARLARGERLSYFEMQDAVTGAGEFKEKTHD